MDDIQMITLERVEKLNRENTATSLRLDICQCQVFRCQNDFLKEDIIQCRTLNASIDTYTIIKKTSEVLDRLSVKLITYSGVYESEQLFH